MMDKIKKSEIASNAKKLYSTDRMISEYYALYDATVQNEKILIIDVNYKYSSTGQIVFDVYSNAEQYAKEVAVCYGRGEESCDKNVYKFGLDIETYIHAGLSRITGYNGCFSYFSTKRLLKFIEAFKPDVIHIHELHAYFVNIKPLIRYIEEKNIPLVWTFHCEYMYTGKCGHAFDCKGFQNKCGNCPAVRDYPKSLFFDKTAQMLKKKKKMLSELNFTVVTPSKWSESRVKESFLRDKPIKTVFNGVDTSVFYPRNIEELRHSLNIGQNTKVVLFVAPNVFDENKGWQWVEKLAELLKDENIVFLMVGKTSTLREHPINMKFVGSINDKNIMASYYSMADAFLLCSKRETYSMTCAEALCCGTPVVGFECGAPETVFKGEFATFVPYGDLEKLRVKLLEMIER